MASIKKILCSLFVHDISGKQPKIVELDKPLRILGMSMDTDVKNIRRDVPALGKRFQQYKQGTEIPNRKRPWAFAAVSKDYDPQMRTFTYIIGDVVTGFEGAPAGLIAFEIPALKYARFPIRPKNRFGWALAIASVKQHAYNVWLPNSDYQAAGTIDDFEYHDEKSTRKKNPQIDLYIAVRDRE